MDVVVFPNDDNVLLLVPKQAGYFDKYRERPYHESLFRDITRYLIEKSIIKGNIVDLGAWIGDNSAPWAKMKDHTVYAIDPSADNCNYISAIAKLNNLKNLKVIQSAISDKDEILSTNDNVEHAAFSQTNSGSTKVKSTSLDNLMRDHTIADVDFIHLDVEGMELTVLKGAHKLIMRYRPIIVYEIHLTMGVDDNNEIVKLLKDSKYNIYLMNEVLPNCRPDCRNVLAIPVERDDKIVDTLTQHLNTFDYVIAAHIRNRCESIKFTNIHKAYQTFMYLQASDLSCVLIRCSEREVLKSFGCRVNECVDFARSTNVRNDYFIEQFVVSHAELYGIKPLLR